MSCLRVVLFVVFMSLGVGANAGSKPDMEAFAVETLKLWNQALNNKDAARFSGLFTFDGVLVAPGGEAVTGMREIYSYVDALVNEEGLSGHEIQVTRVSVNKDRIFITGEWSATQDINGLARGELSTVLEKQFDGSWRTRFVKWN